MKLKYLLLLLPLLCINLYGQVQKSKVSGGSNRLISLPYDRMLCPAGKQILFGDSLLENHALDCALSPDQKWLVVEERYSILFINTANNQIAFTLPLKDAKDLPDAMNTYSGICWYKNKGRDYVLWSTVAANNQSYVVQASWDGVNAEITRQWSYKAQKPAEVALPNEILINRENGKDYLYVVLNGNNQLVKQDMTTGDTLWIRKTGVAPYGIARANGKLYITNWGGRLPKPNDKDVAGVPWGNARINPTNAAVREGSISVIDPVKGRILKNIIVGLHPNEIIADKTGRFIYVTNSNSDKVSVINTATDEISETISIRLQEEMNPYFGDSPDGLCLSPDGSTLYVANGMDNALAVIQLGRNASTKGREISSSLKGYIPTGAYPSAISFSLKNRLYVTNLEAEGANRPLVRGINNAPAFNSHHMLASISIIDVPNSKELKSYTNTVIAVNQLSRLQSAQLSPRKGVAPRPLPERIGEPSVFKHVLYIIKENRTYDQILGDMKQGDGDSTLCVFGKQVTPNIHQLANDFILLDNFFVAGKCSAEGHQWTDASIVTDYIEKNVRAWFRSYPHVQEDALVYAPSGFLWDNAKKHNKNVRIYGEASTPVFDKSLDWTAIYNGFLKGNPFIFKNKTTLVTVRDILSPSYPAYDNHKI
ncbi:MAG: YncE family protein, partial [Bacteroidota bacterium]|nr:YncE family protein [Bacteroidota bacterium]